MSKWSQAVVADGPGVASRTTPTRERTVVLFRRFGPYHHARLRAAGQLLDLTGIELTGSDNVYAWDKVDGSEGFRRVGLFPEEDIDVMPAEAIYAKLSHELSNFNPRVVVLPGWSELASLAALHWCASRRVPFVMMSESTRWDDKRSRSKEWIKSRIVRLSAAALAGGRPHAEYLKELGLPADRIFLGYDAVENEYFAKGAEAARARGMGEGRWSLQDKGRYDVAEVRKKYGLPENYFLASARFVEKKNLARLIEAYARYRELVKKSEIRNQKPEIWELILLGDGPLKADLWGLISELSLQDHVLLPGFKQYDELPVYYGHAGAFVHASTVEQWGLVVNEAMASGLPVLVSKRCGCAQDLVRDGVNGFTFDPYNTEELAVLMLKISALEFPRCQFGAASRDIISNWGPDRFADGLHQAVEFALKNPRPCASLLDRLLLRLLFLR